jgi:hypothetical protein
MNIASNPWSFVPGDVQVSTPSASPNGLLPQSDGTVNFVTAGTHPFAVGNNVTIIDPTNDLYEGYYQVRTVPDNQHANLVPQGTFKIPVGTGNSGGGTVALVQYAYQVRIEDMSWQQQTAQGNVLLIVDRNGNPIWNATASSANFQNRGKVFWVNGFALQQMDAGILLVTVN